MNAIKIERLDHFGIGVKASHFNRFKLGRSLDAVFDYGTDTLFAELALSALRKRSINVSITWIPPRFR